VRRREHRGAIVWAIVPYLFEAPFSIVGGSTAETTFATADNVARAVYHDRLDPEQRYAVRAKVRPILLLQDRPLGLLPEFAALRLVRLEKLAAQDRERIRRGEARTLVYLGDVPGLKLGKESAVDVGSLVRVHESALVGRPVGRVEEGMLRDIGERVVEQLDLDLTALIDRRLLTLLARARRA